MDLHPYDGVERRFHHTDADLATGLSVVARVLHLPGPPPREGVFYDLSFYSGGIGVLDNRAITLPADSATWATVTAATGAKPLEEASRDAGWADELLGLFASEEKPVPLREAAVRFINGERREFQSECLPTGRILFAEGSGVNYWEALWGDGATLNYLRYDQG
jgi:hypothetical protein